MLLYQILAFTIHGKIQKLHTKTISLKYLLQHEIINWNYLMDDVFYLIFHDFWVHHEKYKTVTDNPPVKIYVNKIENKITFKINSGYYLELWTPETIKVVEIAKNKINIDKNGKNISHLLKCASYYLINFSSLQYC